MVQLIMRIKQPAGICISVQMIYEANLFDLDQKYADVMSLDEVKAELARLAPDQANVEGGG